jgi:hypothetical protein
MASALQYLLNARGVRAIKIIENVPYNLSFFASEHFSTFSFGRRKIIHSVEKYKLNLMKSALKKRANTHAC